MSGSVEIHKLPFLEMRHYPDDMIVELIANEGIDLKAEQCQIMLDKIGSLTPPVQGILVNRKNSYSISFEAQRMIRSYKGVKAIAVLTHSPVSYVAAKTVTAMFIKMGVFMDRDRALDWLKTIINK